MATQFLSEANKLKNIQIYLEKNDNLFNYISKYGCELNLVDYFLNLEKERTSDVDKITTELRNIWQVLRSQKKFLQEGNVHNLDLGLFKQEMIKLQEAILNLKTKLLRDTEKLKNQEKSIWEMIELFNQKLTEWDKTVKIPNNHSYGLSKNIAIDSDHYKEVLEFMDFVNKNYGHENGWSSEDHQLFLKLRRKYKNIEELAVNLNKLLPDISMDEVRQHEAWFDKYMFLKNKKDEALEKWRKDKKENISQKADKNNISPIKTRAHLKPKDENVHEKIAFWRAEKEAKRQQENAQEQMKLAKEKLFEAQKRRFDSQVKQEVVKWRKAKMEKEYNEKVQKELTEHYQKRIRAATANKLIRQFQTQDDLFVARMRKTRLKKKNDTKKRSKSSYSVERDPERILRPTKQWLLRTKKDHFDDYEISTYVPNIRVIPKLKIPDWRRNSTITN